MCKSVPKQIAASLLWRDLFFGQLMQAAVFCHLLHPLLIEQLLDAPLFIALLPIYGLLPLAFLVMPQAAFRRR